MYAILDIESTGGKYNEESITEIAIYKFDGHEVVDQFISLVNPEKPIQDYVVKLTGISNDMLKNAPKFHEVAKRIIEITKDCILVAHNASFDYRMLVLEFNRLGYKYLRDTICTVDVSKILLPNQETYKLGKLAKNLGIPVSSRHRASGDALATVQLFKLLLVKDVEKNIISKSVQYFDERTTKDKLNTLLEKTPTQQGVFYLFDKNKKVIFLGKGKNMKQELTNLFLKSTKRGLKIQKNVDSINFEITGNELFTRLRYYLELDVLSPKYNFKKTHKIKLEPFNNSDFLLFDKGRTIEEHAVILVKNNTVVKYGYTNLAYQENNLAILENVLTAITNTAIANTIVKNHLKRHTPKKLIRL